MEIKKYIAPLLAGLLGGAGGSALLLSLVAPHQSTSIGPAIAMAAGEDDQTRIIEAIKRVKPSVVALDVVVNGHRLVPQDPFSQFFGGNGGDQLVPFHAQASGSGFVVSKDGLIATNDHVVHGATSIEVVFADGSKVKGKIFSEDESSDLALVKVDARNLPPPVEFGSSRDVQQGEWAIAIGEPLELKDTVTVGVVSAFNRDETVGGETGFPRQFKGLLQTSAPINPGNSGGPLIDLDGRVIGIDQSVARPAQGIGFAIPVDAVKKTVAYLEAHPGAHNNVANAFMGVQLASLSDVRNQIDYQGNGVAIVGVVGGTPADKAGLQPGDVIQTVNGKEVSSPQDVTKIVHAMKPGQRVEMRVWSSGVKKLVALQLGQAPSGD